tara:strand:+ start:12 stop:470 length:459 start_codon:yes stop_codon:yes gene_type:complete
MVNPAVNPNELTGFEDINQISTIKKLTNPFEVSGEGINTPKQVGDTLKSTNTVQDNLYSGYISANRQYAVKHCFLKEFERQKMLGQDLDSKNFPLYRSLFTMSAKMALLDLQSSNSIDGKYQTNIIEAITGNIKRFWNKFSNKNDNNDAELR